MSGSPLCPFWGFQSGDEALEMAFTLGKGLKLKGNHSKENLLDLLYKAPGSKIIEHSMKITAVSFLLKI